MPNFSTRQEAEGWAEMEARHVHEELGIVDVAAVPKRRRNKLAKAELWLLLAGTAEHLSDYSSHTLRIAKTYGLTEAEVDRLCHWIGQELENRADLAGYEEAWIA